MESEIKLIENMSTKMKLGKPGGSNQQKFEAIQSVFISDNQKNYQVVEYEQSTKVEIFPLPF